MGSCTVGVRVRHCGIQGRGTTDGEGSNWRLGGLALSEARKEDPVGSWSLGRPSAEAVTSEAGASEGALERWTRRTLCERLCRSLGAMERFLSVSLFGIV